MSPHRWRPPHLPDEEPAAVILTRQQAVVLSGICLGKTNQQIATALAVTDHTVKSHVKGVLAALGASDRTHAAVLAITGQVDITVHTTTRRAA